MRTASWLYARLRRPSYTERTLRGWAERLHAPPVTAAYVFFEHEEAGRGPTLASHFVALAAGMREQPAAPLT